MNRTVAILGFAACALASTCILTGQSFPAGQPHKFVQAVTVRQDGFISVNDVLYSPPGGRTSGMHVVTFNRQSLALLRDTAFYTSDAFNSYIDSILKGSGQPEDALVLAASISINGFPLSAVASSLKKLGATDEFDGQHNTNGALAFIGHGGLKMGQAYQSGGAISGYFAADTQGRYAFIPLDYLTYSLDPIGGKITAGNQTWTAGCNNGLFLVEFDRKDPRMARSVTCYQTGFGDETALNGLKAALVRGNSREDSGVFLISVGSPLPANPPARQKTIIGNIAASIRDLGGYAETFNALGPSNLYALVGSPATPPSAPSSQRRGIEASDLYPGRPRGKLVGALGRGRRYTLYSPVNGDSTGLENTGLYAIVGQPDSLFPHPANQAELDEFQYINQYLCNKGDNCPTFNVRDQYANTNVPPTNFQVKLLELTGHNGVNCSNGQNQGAPFCIVRRELLNELGYANAIRSLSNNLDDLLTKNQINDGFKLKATYERLQNQVNAPPGNATASIITTVVSGALNIGAALPTPLSPALGFVGAVFQMGAGLLNDPQGNSKSFNYSTTVANLADDAVSGFNDQLNSLGTFFNFICQDWGRLEELGSALESATPGTPWYWAGNTTTAQLLSTLTLGSERSYYESLLAARYQIGYFEVPTVYNYTVKSLGCSIDGVAHPFFAYTQYPLDFVKYNRPGTDVMETQPNFGGPGHPDDKGWLAIADRRTRSTACQYASPGPVIMERLFKLPGTTGTEGLGVYRPEFFNSGTFSHIRCGPSGAYDGKTLGCLWGSGTSQNNLSASIESANRIGDLLQVRVTIANEGAADLQSVTVDHISVRVLEGSGEVTVHNPHTLIVSADLPPGASATIEIDLEAPMTVEKFSLVEDGTMQNGADVLQFSESQVLFPQQVAEKRGQTPISLV